MMGNRSLRIACFVVCALCVVFAVSTGMPVRGDTASSAVALLDYQRVGGGKPSDSEHLIITAEGAFRLRRTVGTNRIGSFAGSVPASRLRSVRAAVTTVRASFSSDGPLASEALTERMTVGPYGLTLLSQADAPASWTKVLSLVRSLTDSLTASPVAAIDLRASRGAPHAELRHIGTAPFVVVGPEMTIELFIVDSRDRTRAQWTSQDRLGEVRATPRWRHDLGLERSGLKLRRGESYSVTITTAVRGDDGVVRTGRLSVSTG